MSKDQYDECKAHGIISKDEYDAFVRSPEYAEHQEEQRQRQQQKEEEQQQDGGEGEERRQAAPSTSSPQLPGKRPMRRSQTTKPSSAGRRG